MPPNRRRNTRGGQIESPLIGQWVIRVNQSGRLIAIVLFVFGHETMASLSKIESDTELHHKMPTKMERLKYQPHA
ncbi:hypothetical protein BLOT_014800 [Blomia tropicalis]|nr:hypothetical protein BLOT_014800 [Blomia tropicalis]